jgi:hypothetical protein
LNRFWRQLEAQHGLAAVRQGWAFALGPAYEPALAFLRDTGEQACEYPCPEGCGCRHHVVRHEEGDIVAACQCEDYHCPNLTVTEDDLRVFALDQAKLGRAIARALDCNPVDVALPVAGVRQITAFGYPPMPILLAICHSPQELLGTTNALVAAIRSRFVLLCPTGQFVDARLQTLLTSVGAGFMDLASIVSLNPGGRLHAGRKAGELFSSYLPPQPGPLTRSEAERVFALLKYLEDGPRVTKAPRIRVFNFLVLEGRSQNEAAREFKCAPSLISKRVKSIEAVMKRPIGELRLLGRELGEMQGRSSSAPGTTAHGNHNDQEMEEKDG